MPKVVSIGGNLYEFQPTAGELICRTLTADSLFDEALVMEERGDSQGALDLYNQALVYDPQAAGVMVNIGNIYFYRYQLEFAESWFRRALKVSPEYALAHFNLANCLDGMDKRFRSNAIYHYKRALEIDPRYADAHYNIAICYQNDYSFGKAILHWKAYLSFDKSSLWADVARRELRKIISREYGIQIVERFA